MASRYDRGSAVVAPGTVRTASSQTTGSTGRSSNTQREQVDIDFLSAQGRQSLDMLIAQLAAGGTPGQRAIQEDVLRTIQAIEVQRTQFSKEAAFRDAEGAIQTQLQRSLEATLPSILLASTGAGTSGDALSALLTNDLSARAAGEASALGIDAAARFGQISASLLGTQAELVDREDPALNALLQALQIDRGSSERGTRTTTGRQSQSQRQTTQQRQTQVTSPGADTGAARESQRI